MDEKLFEALNNEISKRLDELNKSKTELESNLSDERGLQGDELNNARNELQRVNDEITKINGDRDELQDLNKRRAELEEIDNNKIAELNKRKRRLQEEKEQLEQGIGESKNSSNSETYRMIRDLVQVNKELLAISKEKSRIRRNKDIANIDKIIDDYVKQYGIDKESILAQRTDKKESPKSRYADATSRKSEKSNNENKEKSSKSDKKVTIQKPKGNLDKKEKSAKKENPKENNKTENEPKKYSMSALEKYKSEGYGKNAFGEYFNPWTDEYDPNYDPEKDKYYNPQLDKEKSKSPALQKYENEGYGKNAFGEYFNPWIDEYDPDYDPEKDNYYNQEYKGKSGQSTGKDNGQKDNGQKDNGQKDDGQKDDEQKKVQDRSNHFVNLKNKFQNNQKDIEKINNLMEKYKDDPEKIKNLKNLKDRLVKENEELSKEMDEMNKYKLTIPQKTELKPKKMEIVPIDVKDKVVFNIRTGTYTIIDKNKNVLVIKANKKQGKEDLEEIMNKTSLSKSEAKKVDINLYNILKQMDARNNTKKADEYLKAFTGKSKDKMPVDLTYDIRKKNSDGEKEKAVKKMGIIEKARMKSLAKNHEKRGIAKVLQDRSLFKKFLLGLGIGAAATTLALGAPDINRGNNQPETQKEQEMTDDSRDNSTNINDLDKENSLGNGNSLGDEDNLGITEEQMEEMIDEEISKMEATNLVLVKGGQEYIEASDLTQTGRRGAFSEDMRCQITNRAIVEVSEDGTEKIIVTSKGKSWEEAGVNLDDYKADNYVEKYALEAKAGETDSRGYSRFGWVNAENCEKLYERNQEINGQDYIIYYTRGDVREMVENDIKSNGVSIQARMKVSANSLNTQKDSQQQTAQRSAEELDR